jgi:hypothetical protein
MIISWSEAFVSSIERVTMWNVSCRGLLNSLARGATNKEAQLKTDRLGAHCLCVHLSQSINNCEEEEARSRSLIL